MQMWPWTPCILLDEFYKDFEGDGKEYLKEKIKYLEEEKKD